MNRKKLARKQSTPLSRRVFLVETASAAGAFTILPRHILGGPGYVPPSDRIALACIGVGAQGTRVMMEFLKQPDVQVVAVCDANKESSDYVEWGPGEILSKERQLIGNNNWGSDWKGCTCGREPARRLVEAYYARRYGSSSYKGCASYNDFRELLEKEESLDGVVVCTTDHWHAAISIAAMRKGKHVYCQKPMTHSISEARRVAEVARATKLATQVAIGNSASDATRHLTEWIAAGVIGRVREVHNWSSRPFWPQGIDPPKQAEPVPEALDWDLWLGPAPERPYNHVYLPFVWRGWFDFGSSAIGDMGCYSFDTLFRVLKLGAPESVEASSTQVFSETYPLACTIHFEFPARGDLPPVKVHWYDGGMRPDRPDELEESVDMRGEDGEGLILAGESGKIFCGFEGQRPRLIPSSKMKAFQPPPDTLPKSIGHYREWIEAAKGGEPPHANFEFEAPITEAFLLGNVAGRAGKRLHWDSANMRITNDAGANDLLNPPTRSVRKV